MLLDHAIDMINGVGRALLSFSIPNLCNVLISPDFCEQARNPDYYFAQTVSRIATNGACRPFKRMEVHAIDQYQATNIARLAFQIRQ